MFILKLSGFIGNPLKLHTAPFLVIHCGVFNFFTARVCHSAKRGGQKMLFFDRIGAGLCLSTI